MGEGKQAEWTVAPVGCDMDLDLRMAQHPVHGACVSGAGVAELC